jgi:Uma2 family endonuclease
MAQRIPVRVSYEDWLALDTNNKLVEWDDGEVIAFMPPRQIHQLVVLLLAPLMALYAGRRGFGRVIAAPFEMRLARSAREPDILFVANESLARLSEERLLGPADLVVEIVSDDSTARDRVRKFAEYEAAGVREYWLSDPRPGRDTLDVFALGSDGRYAPIVPDAAGVIRSVVLPGFWLDPSWLRQRPLPDSLDLLGRIAPDLLPTVSR